jgi:hypothetical protein
MNSTRRPRHHARRRSPTGGKLLLQAQGIAKMQFNLYGFIFHRMNNGEYNAINVLQYIIIPKANHIVPL